jgi:hypothetical protein
MAEETDHAIQVAVRVWHCCFLQFGGLFQRPLLGSPMQVRPLNDRERDAGFRECVLLDDETKQVVLAVGVSNSWRVRFDQQADFCLPTGCGQKHTPTTSWILG